MIVLLTDFGQSEYVGVMKGVIYSIDLNAKIVDLCHDISPQSTIEASWILKNNYRYFPKETVFCCVVDPGVGTRRKALAVKTGPLPQCKSGEAGACNFYFVAPDNGLLWETLTELSVIEIRQIPIPDDASRTFHGRDVFAKAAANINQGKFETIGKKIEKVEKLELYLDGQTGMVVRIDRFGNIVTNLAKRDKDEYDVKIGDKKYTMRYYHNYDSAEEGKLFLIEGSNNTLEISLKNASANDKLHLRPEKRISIS